MVKKKTQSEEKGRFAYQGLDRIIHEKARLGILTSMLTRKEGILFTDLKTLCSLTDGNLSRHLKALENEGLVEMWKRFRNNRPQTLCRLTPSGRKRFIEYIQELERVVKDASLSEKKMYQKSGEHEQPGFSMA